MILDELAAHIVASSTAFTEGTNLFKSKLPATSPNTAVALYESGGITPGARLSTTNAFEQPSFQVLSRSTSYVTARQNAQIVWNIFDGFADSTLTNVRYLSIVPVQSPFPVGRDENSRHLISVNFNVRKETT